MNKRHIIRLALLSDGPVWLQAQNSNPYIYTKRGNTYYEVGYLRVSGSVCLWQPYPVSYENVKAAIVIIQE